MSNFLTRLLARNPPSPEAADAHVQRANDLRSAGQLDAALAEYDRALKSQPDHVGALFSRATLVRQLGRTHEALRDYDRVVALAPGLMPVYYNRGLAHTVLENWPAALADFQQSVTLNADFVAGWAARGVALVKLGRCGDALQSYDRAIALQGDDAELHFHRGNALMDLGRWDVAVHSFEQAIRLRADYVEAHANLGSALLESRNVDASIASFDRAIALQGLAAEPRYNRSLALLLRGDHAAGWAGYESRWEGSHGHTLGDTSLLQEPRWSGREEIRGRRLAVWAEQGLGDTLQFCRLLPLVAARDAEVIFIVQAPLARLLTGFEGVAQRVTQGEAVPEFDLQCPLLSLPAALGMTLATIPANVPYIHADPEGIAGWRAQLQSTGAPRVGIAWAGNPQNRNDRRRSLALSRLLAGLPAGMELISLQKDVPESDRAALAGATGLRCLLQPHHDFSDTAALVAALDLVICVDTAVAHLAGAMGKPVWLLNRYNGCWRWLLDRPDSPWYPTLRVYRQDSPDDWEGVLRRVSADLQRMNTASTTRPPA